ncbi:MAG: DoxX family protein [Phycisphaerales bacterium]|nr:DoxX family protein [Phycisphaerales bacterium]
MSNVPLRSIPPAPAGDSCSTSGASCGCPLRAFVPLTLRLTLGGLLIFSGWLKLGISSFGGTLSTIDPQTVLYAIKGFQIPWLSDQPDLMAFLAFAVPWVELISGVALVLGLWTRAAAIVVALTMVGFTAGIIGIVARGLDVKCPCFGAMKFICGAEIGTCHIVRNTGFFLAAVVIAKMGHGALGLDGVTSRKA